MLREKSPVMFSQIKSAHNLNYKESSNKKPTLLVCGRKVGPYCPWVLNLKCPIESTCLLAFGSKSSLSGPWCQALISEAYAKLHKLRHMNWLYYWHFKLLPEVMKLYVSSFITPVGAGHES